MAKCLFISNLFCECKFLSQLLIMPEQTLGASQVEPVFILSKHLPDGIDIPTLCRAAEAVSGSSSIVGAYGDGGLWRL